MKQRTLLPLVVAASLLACGRAESHSIQVSNETSVVIERVGVTIGKDRSSLGGLAPGVCGILIFQGPWPEQVTVDWMEGEAGRSVVVPLTNVPPGFRGTVILKARSGGKVDVSLERPNSEP
jgi:hypothetical protein